MASPSRCCVPNCKTTRGERLHVFPKDLRRGYLWLNAVRNPELAKMNYDEIHKRRFAVCHLHFREDSLAVTHSVLRLKNHIVPTLFLPQEEVKIENSCIDLKDTDTSNNYSISFEDITQKFLDEAVMNSEDFIITREKFWLNHESKQEKLMITNGHNEPGLPKTEILDTEITDDFTLTDKPQSAENDIEKYDFEKNDFESHKLFKCCESNNMLTPRVCLACDAVYHPICLKKRKGYKVIDDLYIICCDESLIKDDVDIFSQDKENHSNSLHMIIRSLKLKLAMEKRKVKKLSIEIDEMNK